MSGAVVGPSLAALIGLVLSYIEVYNKAGAWPKNEILKWAVLRVSVDASVCMITYPAATLVVRTQDWWWAAIAAGAGAPILLRTQVSFVGKGGGAKEFGPAVVYGKVRDWIDGKIARMTSSADSAWIVNDVTPLALKSISSDQLEARVSGYLNVYAVRNGTSVTVELTNLKKNMRISATDPAGGYAAIFFQLLFSGHREFIDTLVKKFEARLPLSADAVQDADPSVASALDAQTPAIEVQPQGTVEEESSS